MLKLINPVFNPFHRCMLWVLHDQGHAKYHSQNWEESQVLSVLNPRVLSSDQEIVGEDFNTRPRVEYLASLFGKSQLAELLC